MNTGADFSVGLEEELFLVNKHSSILCEQWPEALWQQCHKTYTNQIIREFLSGQVELVSKPAHSISQLNHEMYQLRRFFIDKANQFNLAPMASSTHPTAKWRTQSPTPSKRYQRLSDELKISADRMLVCGTHIHIGISDLKQRLRLYNELAYFLPLILSLTSSSPFWAGLDSGMQSYRATILNGLPRAGLPPVFSSVDDYQRYLSHMINAGAITSAKELWWDLRLSAHFPTVELRIGDTCTDLDDLLAVAAFVQTLSHYLLSRTALNKSMLDIRHLCAKENRWRAQRYSQEKNLFLVTGSKSLQPARAVIYSLIERLKPHAKELGCESYLEHCEYIYQRGTSADLQRKVFEKAIQNGASIDDAMHQVSSYLIQKTALIKAPESTQRPQME